MIADPRFDTEAFIFDRQLDGTVPVNATESRRRANARREGVPQIASVVRMDGTWIVERLTRDERACT
ncbi:MAG: hypothetical protein R2705_19170 [Ilumatobacteraceae bacterium]